MTNEQNWEEDFEILFPSLHCMNEPVWTNKKDLVKQFIKDLLEAERKKVASEIIWLIGSLKHEAIMSTGFRKEERVDGKELIEKLKQKYIGE